MPHNQILVVTTLTCQPNDNLIQWALGDDTYVSSFKQTRIAKDIYDELPIEIVQVGFLYKGIVRDFSIAAKRINKNICIVQTMLFEQMLEIIRK